MLSMCCNSCIKLWKKTLHKWYQKLNLLQRNITVKEYETHQEKKNNPTVALNVFYIKEINT